MSVKSVKSLGSFYTKNKNIILKASYVLLIFLSFTSNSKPNQKNTPTDQVGDKDNKDKDDKYQVKTDKIALKKLAKAILPNFKSPVLFYFILQLLLLATRAILTLKVATLDGLLVSSMIRKKTSNFLKLLVKWMLIGIPASLTNSLLDFTTNQLSLNINKNITRDLMELYLPTDDNKEATATKKNPNYYTMIHMNFKEKVNDPNQRITTDVNNLSSSLASLPNHILKPTLDLILCSFELSRSGSPEGTLVLGLIAHITSLILKIFSPNFTKIAIERSRLEGLLRSLHSRIVLFSEEIGFLRGYQRELDIVDKSYYELEKFTNYEIKARAIYDTATTFIVKYTWGAAGLVLCSTPIFLNKFNGIMDQNSSATFVTNRRLLLSASSSLGMIIRSRKEVQQVFGYFKRLSEFNKILVDIDTKNLKNISNDNVVKYNDDKIEFKKIPLITPANITLAKSLSFVINHGEHLLIAGPNGCGKSSLFRILGGLWPVQGEGELTIPHFENMFYLPQRAYLSKSSLKDQIIYPKNITLELSRNPQLEINQIDPFSTIRNWPEELSIGVQQRLAMARLYYHKPKFAVLDECTSAVSPKMEQLMYSHAQSLGISILSVAHRSSLWHFHTHILKFRGDGTYSFTKLNAEERLNWENELIELNKFLRDVPNLESRLKDLKIAQESQEFKRSQSQISMKKLPVQQIAN
ncbi:ATP-binding cassette sub-family D member 2 [Wickerhamomyces ciferrii]|uniref:ATP-binding cassette sub-family D member 2 n=1 Tax=Wickerhamomyces ciferrii (strain ATCC 14091 / BCRC 22168 / CBS 111 / JCM 3599 / NBRC 0793 / NRRL Y-1031 F-60-10) TaxID=1206466 RepID=K0KZL7_WICCF|nr:ATP-binding cassette sub-family D member 2 [Wickerhamomyces ciferrii]CCH46603.1 ATP-binding cassette sub-family D member 2 [Wickerhamomyces ciferrii]